MGRIKLDTITDFARRGYDAKVVCGACGNAAHWNATELAMELHRRRKSLRIDAVEPHMRCRACGKRGAMIQPVEMF
jgi:primosomal protein N'